MKTKLIYILFFIFLVINNTFGQVSDFEKDTEGWKVTGDVQTGTQTPNWIKAAGNPGAYAQATDDATGGVWYWVAPKKYHGNKCSAYGNRITFDLIQSETNDQFDAIDISIGGGGLTLVMDLPKNPASFWTKYATVLDENSGWKISTLTGATATKADMLTVLSNLNKIWVRGEYRKGKDVGGMDNFVLEAFQNVDLDGDDSSFAKNGNYNGEPICSIGGSSNFCDNDLKLNSLAKIVEIKLSVKGAATTDVVIDVQKTNPNITILNNQTEIVTLKNKGNADTTDFKSLILNTLVTLDKTTTLTSITCDLNVVFSECLTENIVTAKFPILKVGALGKGIDTTICDYDKSFSLFDLLKNNSFFQGKWKYGNQIKDNSLFQPNIDKSGTYRYIIKANGACPTDSVDLNITNFKKPLDILPKDTFICNDKPFVLAVSDPFASKVTWSNGISGPQTFISEPGLYSVKVAFGRCVYTDSINLKSYNCNDCKIYVPNTFSPNGDGVNDFFQAFSDCAFDTYNLKIFDRWGNFIYESNTLDSGWDGIYKGKLMNNDVFTYCIKLQHNYLGKTVEKKINGDILLSQ